ncbi:hypothetical protein VTN77DRAFT_7335 [Rasamsonia byssochlamydoides]|uniref:uncharacterized protein n=1 Tax=Rasamsonia byssochlamydoides TaxID=89139 RepID=UPI003741E8DD
MQGSSRVDSPDFLAAIPDQNRDKAEEGVTHLLFRHFTRGSLLPHIRSGSLGAEQNVLRLSPASSDSRALLLMNPQPLDAFLL